METPRPVPTDLRTFLDGYDVVRSFGRRCPSCAQEYSHGDTLVVAISRGTETGSWSEPSVVCSNCETTEMPDTERSDEAEAFLLSVGVTGTPQALVLDGDSAQVLDYADSDSSND